MNGEILLALAALLKHLGGEVEIPASVLDEIEGDETYFVRMSQETPDSPLYLELSNESKTH